MDPRARRLLSWTFIIAFFVLAPVIILSTAGYRYNFATNRLERTGVIVIETRPTGASVSLNGQPQRAETPARLQHVTPGNYAVRVEKADYHPWTKNVTVGSRESVFLNQISLFSEAAPILLKASAPASVSAFSPDTRYAAAVASASSGSELAIIDTKNGTARLPYRSSAPAASFRLSWSRDGRMLLIARAGKTPAFLLWDASDPDRVRDLSSGASLAFSDAFWAQDAVRLYGVSKGALYEIETDILAVTPLGPAISEPIVAGDALYGIVPGAPPALARRKLQGGDFDTIAELPSANFSPLPGDGRHIAYASPADGQLFAIDSSGDHPAAFEGDGKDGAWSSDGTRLLYWNDFEVRVYDARSGADALIDRLSGPITQAAWHQPEWNALYADANALFAIEANDNYGRVTVPLASFSGLERFAVSPNGDEAYVFGTKNGASGLWKLRLR